MDSGTKFYTLHRGMFGFSFPSPLASQFVRKMRSWSVISPSYRQMRVFTLKFVKTSKIKNHEYNNF